MSPRPPVRLLAFALLLVVSSACDNAAGVLDPDAGLEDMGDSSAATDCDGKAVGVVEQRTRYQRTLVPSDESCLAQEQFRTCQLGGLWSAWSGDYTEASCSVESFADCDGLAHGAVDERTAYETELVPLGSACRSELQTRTCQDGVWSAWSGHFGAAQCRVEGAKSCLDQAHGSVEERTMYEASEVPFGSECRAEKQQRTCDDGEWTPWLGTFAAPACHVIDAQSCGNVAHGGSEQRTRYEQQLVPAGETCQAETQVRICNDGMFAAWSGEFGAELCEVEGQRSCGGVPHDQYARRVRYEHAVEPYGSKCVPEHQTALCTDGVLAEFDGKFAEEACVETPPLDCAGGVHGEIVARDCFPSAEVPYGADCVPTFQFNRCENGAWSGFGVDDCPIQQCIVLPPADCEGGKHGEERERLCYPAVAARFRDGCVAEQQVNSCINGAWTGFGRLCPSETCSVLPPADCQGGKHGQKRKQVRFASSTVPYGQECRSEEQLSTCFDGEWGDYEGSFTAEHCEVLQPLDCDGIPHGETQTRTAYESALVPVGSPCKSEPQTRTCDDGVWSDYSGTYTAESCRVRGKGCTDPLTNTLVEDGDTQTRAQFEAPFPAGSCKSETQRRLCTNGVFAAWSGSYGSAGCAPLSSVSAGGPSCRLYQSGVPTCSEWPGADADQIGCASGELDLTHGCPTGGSAYGRCTCTVQGKTSASYFYDGSRAAHSKTTCTQTGGVWSEL